MRIRQPALVEDLHVPLLGHSRLDLADALIRGATQRPDVARRMDRAVLRLTVDHQVFGVPSDRRVDGALYCFNAGIAAR